MTRGSRRPVVNLTVFVRLCLMLHSLSSELTTLAPSGEYDRTVSVRRRAAAVFHITLSSSNLLRSGCMISSSYQFLPLFPVFSYSFECIICLTHVAFPSFFHRLYLAVMTRTPPVKEHQPVVTYLQFPIQVCFPCNDHVQPAADKAPI